MNSVSCNPPRASRAVHSASPRSVAAAIRLDPGMQEENPVVVQSDTWVIYHSQTKETASWIEVEVTAQKLGLVADPSRIGVHVGTLAVEQGTPDDDRRCFSPTRNPGVMTHLAEAVVHPHASATITSYLSGKVRFEIDAIGDSLLSWSPSGGVAAQDTNTGCFHATATFIGLPTDNSAFGEKYVRLYADGLWGLDTPRKSGCSIRREGSTIRAATTVRQSPAQLLLLLPAD